MQEMAKSGQLSDEMRSALDELASMGDMKRLVGDQGKQLANLFTSTAVGIAFTPL
jgi:hypothetical protein